MKVAIKKRTRSVVHAETLEFKLYTLSQALPMLVQEGWLDARDLCAVEQTCRTAKNVWCSDEAVWKPLVFQTWSHLKNGDVTAGHRRPVVANEEIASYKSLFCDPRLWLEASAERVKALPKWSEMIHCDVECGRCGNGVELDRPLVPIESEFRWEKNEQEVCSYEVLHVTLV